MKICSVKKIRRLGRKFAGWEGGLAPAQDRMPFNVENAIQCCRQRRSTQPRGARGGTPLQLVHLSKPALRDVAGDLGNYFDVERFGDDPVGL
jgi:hypothetical protein